MILDTSFLIALLINKPEAVKKASLIEEEEIIKITSISVFELMKGIKKENHREKVMELMNNLVVLDLTKESAYEAGLISKALILKGKEIEPEDCMIAGIAIVNNEVLLTRNIKHFERVEGLKVEEY